MFLHGNPHFETEAHVDTVNFTIYIYYIYKSYHICLLDNGHKTKLTDFNINT